MTGLIISSCGAACEQAEAEAEAVRAGGGGREAGAAEQRDDKRTHGFAGAQHQTQGAPDSALRTSTLPEAELKAMELSGELVPCLYLHPTLLQTPRAAARGIVYGLRALPVPLQDRSSTLAALVAAKEAEAAAVREQLSRGPLGRSQSVGGGAPTAHSGGPGPLLTAVSFPQPAQQLRQPGLMCSTPQVSCALFEYVSSA